jgi:hypothetical protein
MNTVPRGLPPTFTTAQMLFLTGLSIGRLDQLAQSGVINRLSKGVYAPDSVARYIKFQRESAAGPQDLRAVRVALMKEKLRLAQLERGEREGRLLLKDDVISLNVSIVHVVKSRLLSTPTSIAPRLVELHRAAEAEAIVRDAITEALLELSQLEAVVTGKRERHRR